jgi:phage terminase large subunit-like protein
MNSLSSASDPLSPPSLKPLLLELERAKRELIQRAATNRLATYRPYTKQKDFHAAGARFRERLFMAGNQLGKTIGGGFEAAIHATGKYPDWWDGRRFDKPTVGWAAGVTGESTRDTVQRVLLGRPNAHGTGSIPKDDIVETVSARGVADLVDTIRIKHCSGGVSTISLKSYEKGRAKWQGETLDWVWFDEEPDAGIYTEGLTRTNATGGLVWMTFTPLMGMSDVVGRFLLEPSNDRHVTTMTIEDAEHYTPEQRAQIIKSYPSHEREARANGVPVLGSGRVFPIAEEDIKCAAFPIPNTWPRIGGLDFGWDHPFAAVDLAWDRDTDRIYITRSYRQRETTPVFHAAALKPWGAWLPWAWPHDGLQHDKGSGEQLAVEYRNAGLNMLPERATFSDGSFGVEAGITRLLQRMQTGRLKVFEHLGDWFEEFRLYHRKDGLIVKVKDDLMSATRYAEMMLRFASTEPKDEKLEGGYSGPSAWLG